METSGSSVWTPKFSLPVKGIILVCLPLIFELVFVITLTHLVSEAEADAAQAVRSAQLIQAGHRLIELAFASASGCQGYASTGNPLYRDMYKQATTDYPLVLKEFSETKHSSPEQEAAQQQIQVLSKRYLAILAHDMTPAGLAEEEQSLSAEVLSMLQNRIEDFLSEEEDIRDRQYVAQAKARQQLNQVVFFAVGCNLLLAVGLSLFFSSNITKRIGVVIENTGRLSKGKPLKPFVGGHDEITELDKVFHEMATTLQELERVKREFVAMVTHDLRVPLSSIQLFLQALTGGMFGDVSDKMKTRATSAERNAEHLLKLIKDLLDISQLDSGNFRLDVREVDMTKLIDSAIENVRPSATDHNITITPPATEKTMVWADGDRITQVLTNLLSNAVNYSPDNSSITIDCKSEDHTLKVTVTDRGLGIADQFQNDIFDRFKRLPVREGEVRPGSGLGLAICKSLVEKHGGVIGVRSEEGNGSTFWFTLPLDHENGTHP